MIRGRLSVLTFALVVSTALSGSALAADIVEDTGYDWTGFYAGGHVGWGWADLKGNYDGEANDFDGFGDFKLKDDDFLGGAQIGYNLQSGDLVLGIEGDFAFASWKDDETNEDDERVSFDADYLATLRLRAGFAMDNLLLFATAGVAWTEVKYTANDDVDDPDPGEVGSVKFDAFGLVVGGGAEYAIDENWSIKADVLYAFFNEDKETPTITDDAEAGNFIELEDIFVARVGVNFHF